MTQTNSAEQHLSSVNRGAKIADETNIGQANSMRRGPGPEVMAADTLEGDSVVNASGEKLGDIEHIMLDVRSGRIAYAVLEAGGFLGIGTKLFAIPWHALTLDTNSHCFILNVNKEQLRNAPGFDDDNWPSLGDERWARDVHAYYEVDAYWD
jgi:sporulation protein YlmC with PRC-barrel domain